MGADEGFGFALGAFVGVAEALARVELALTHEARARAGDECGADVGDAAQGALPLGFVGQVDDTLCAADVDAAGRLERMVEPDGGGRVDHAGGAVGERRVGVLGEAEALEGEVRGMDLEAVEDGGVLGGRPQLLDQDPHAVGGGLALFPADKQDEARLRQPVHEAPQHLPAEEAGGSCYDELLPQALLPQLTLTAQAR